MDTRHTTVKGTWAYSASRLQQQGDLVCGSQISIRREPNNPHDRNAAAVYLGQSKLGFLPRELAAELASYFDIGGKYRAEISHVGTRTYKRNTYPSVSIDINLNDLDPPIGISSLLSAATGFVGVRGVYSIENITNGGIYIGSSDDVGKRLRNHIIELRNGTHANYRLSNAWRISGPEAFRVSLIERVTGPGIRERERYHIQRLDAHGSGYNQTSDGAGSKPLPASQRWKLTSNRLPHQYEAQSSQPQPGRPTVSYTPSVEAGKGCLLLVLCSVTVMVIGVWITSSRY